MAGTIYALSSPRGSGGVAVIRVSGPSAHQALRQLAGDVPQPRYAAVRTLRDATGAALDRALVLAFAGPGSATGEDMAEFHVHGGRAVVAAVLDALAKLDDVRLAEPGEFTRRALFNNKMDLTQAEAIGDLIAAETQAQRVQALRQAEGGLTKQYEAWRAQAIKLRALIEAGIDFSDEDLGLDLGAQATPIRDGLSAAITRHLNDGRRGEILRDGVQVAIIGAPNVGKSSLLNRLAGREVAIVSARAGTTRDVVEVRLDLEGVPVILADTAGLREAGDEIEAEGIARAKARARGADLALVVRAAGEVEDASGDAALAELDLAPERVLHVINKIDVAADAAVHAAQHGAQQNGMAVSAKTGAGFEALVEVLGTRAASLAGLSEAPMITRTRHRACLGAALAALKAMDLAHPDLAAEDARVVCDQLGRLTGRVDVEDVLDVLFKEFCVGK